MVNIAALEFPWVVADIGGTNARFTLVEGFNSQQGGYQLSQSREYVTGDYASLVDCLAAYLADLNNVQPKYACIAVAGPVHGDRVQFTNVHWDFSIAASRDQLNLEHLEVINDFQALACSVPYIGDDDFYTVIEGLDNTEAPKAIIGPGTGLGVAGLVPTRDGWHPISTEGGHRAFAPQSSRELALCEDMLARFGYVCVENLLSGMGLVNIYQSLLALDKTPSMDSVTPQTITRAALDNSDKTAVETLDLFCAVLGSVCGDLALTYGAKGGVYLGGGILPRIQEYLMQSQFKERFIAKGLMSEYMDGIAVKLITHKQPALIGAAAWLGDQLG